MQSVGVDFLKAKGLTRKFILNDSAIVFFPGNQEHRDVKTAGLSYEDNYGGNALAGLVTPDRVEIRYHRAFSDERVRNLWRQVLKNPEIAGAGLGDLYYQGRKIL